LKKLRDKAEQALKSEQPIKRTNLSAERAEALIHELELHQVELEMQNDELRTSRLETEKSRMYFAVLFDVAPVAYFLLNEAGLIDQYNTTAKHLIGKEVSLIKRRLHAFVHEADTDVFYKFLMKLKASGKKESCEFRIRTAPEKVLYVTASGTFINMENSPKQYYISLTDITERHNAETRLVEMNERLDMAMEASATGVWSVDLRTRIVSGDEIQYVWFSRRDHH
jgi:PAS domain S-box-containing protein